MPVDIYYVTEVEENIFQTSAFLAFNDYRIILIFFGP
jgi:hypothetical protein